LCSYETYSITKTFALTKLLPPEDGVTPAVYELGVDTTVIKREGARYVPNPVLVRAWVKDGQGKRKFDGYLELSCDEGDLVSLETLSEGW
jgi:hypothetical protein